MNHEVKSFQNYESITIGELKDQANSLLNLVTEEQRPLRVCMNNGKEFLLVPSRPARSDLRFRLSLDPAVSNAVCDGQKHMYARGGFRLYQASHSSSG